MQEQGKNDRRHSTGVGRWAGRTVVASLLAVLGTSLVGLSQATPGGVTSAYADPTDDVEAVEPWGPDTGRELRRATTQDGEATQTVIEYERAVSYVSTIASCTTTLTIERPVRDPWTPVAIGRTYGTVGSGCASGQTFGVRLQQRVCGLFGCNWQWRGNTAWRSVSPGTTQVGSSVHDPCTGNDLWRTRADWANWQGFIDWSFAQSSPTRELNCS